jgi:hypothetical protein
MRYTMFSGLVLGLLSVAAPAHARVWVRAGFAPVIVAPVVVAPAPVVVEATPVIVAPAPVIVAPAPVVVVPAPVVVVPELVVVAPASVVVTTPVIAPAVVYGTGFYHGVRGGFVHHRR